VQLTTDGHGPYLTVVEPLFGSDGIDFAILHKLYGADPNGERTYSPAVVTGFDKRTICGDPRRSSCLDFLRGAPNLTMRMNMRRFTRLTNGFSKKVENHAAAVALHFMHYNFARKHQTLRTTPAVAAGIERHPWSLTQLVDRLD